jgi:hypothetical protein
MRLIIVLFVAFSLAAGGGCSFSKSSGWISDSISSPFKSSSASSSGDDDDAEPEAPEDVASYEEDVTQLASTYAKSGGDIGAFRGAVSQLAMARGITNWEVDSTTCQAIGRGVGNGGMEEERFTAFSKEIFGDDLIKQNELHKGYQQSAQSPNS